MEPTINLSGIQQKFRSALADYYPEQEIREIFLLTAEQVLNYSKIDTFLRAGDSISQNTADKFDQILARLMKWEPVQYILGYTVFYGLPFEVDQRVLIPRQETEELVDWIIKSEGGKAADILDMGCGSGCIAVSLAVNMPMAKIYGCDISEAALAVSDYNARANKAPVAFFAHDLLDDTLNLPRKYHIVVSNPPYVRQQEKKQMHRNVLDFEPALALFVPDEDPLVYYKSIALLARKYIHDGGTLYLEINEFMPEELVRLLKCTGFYAIEVKRDLNGRSRMIRAKK